MITQPDIIRSGYVEDGGVGPVALSSEIKDTAQGKMQSEINQTALDWAVLGWVL